MRRADRPGRRAGPPRGGQRPAALPAIARSRLPGTRPRSCRSSACGRAPPSPRWTSCARSARRPRRTVPGGRGEPGFSRERRPRQAQLRGEGPGETGPGRLMRVRLQNR